MNGTNSIRKRQVSVCFVAVSVLPDEEEALWNQVMKEEEKNISMGQICQGRY